MFLWQSHVKRSTTIIDIWNRHLEGRRVIVCGYAPSLDDLGPPQLFLPDNHTGTLTGLVKFETYVRELPHPCKPIACTIYAVVKWDDISTWHRNFCSHGKWIGRSSCLIDWYMSQHAVPPMFLFFIDEDGNKIGNVEEAIIAMGTYRYTVDPQYSLVSIVYPHGQCP